MALAAPAFAGAGVPDALEHVRVEGAHALDQRRFDAIVDWVIGVAR